MPKGPGPCSFLTPPTACGGRSITACGGRSITARGGRSITARGGRSLTTRLEAAAVLAAGLPRICSGCRSSNPAWPRPTCRAAATGSMRVVRSTSAVSRHSGATPSWCWWLRDVRGQGPDHVQRDTTSDGMLAFGHSRSGLPCPCGSAGCGAPVHKAKGRPFDSCTRSQPCRARSIGGAALS